MKFLFDPSSNELASLDVTERVARTLFLFFVTCAFAFAVWRVSDETGMKPDDVKDYYGESDPDDMFDAVPSITKKRLVEVTHVHIFMIPTVFFLVSLMVVKSGLKPKFALPLIVFGFLSVGMDLSSMWLTRFVNANFVYGIVLSGTIMSGSMGLMILSCLKAMWLDKPGDA
ncbi:hypothetical protein KDL45_00825 [bacterium]|nr:hypothetical protein [bacterium]